MMHELVLRAAGVVAALGAGAVRRKNQLNHKGTDSFDGMRRQPLKISAQTTDRSLRELYLCNDAGGPEP